MCYVCALCSHFVQYICVTCVLSAQFSYHVHSESHSVEKTIKLLSQVLSLVNTPQLVSFHIDVDQGDGVGAFVNTVFNLYGCVHKCSK